jgi:hypothetical protein
MTELEQVERDIATLQESARLAMHALDDPSLSLRGEIASRRASSFISGISLSC